MKTIAEQAAALGVDENNLSGLLEFLKRNILNNPEALAMFQKNPGEVIRQGVEAWMKMGTEFYNELLENKTERAKEYRAMIAEQTWTEARRKQGLPV